MREAGVKLKSIRAGNTRFGEHHTPQKPGLYGWYRPGLYVRLNGDSGSEKIPAFVMAKALPGAGCFFAPKIAVLLLSFAVK